MELLGSNDDTTYVRLWYDDTDDFPGAKTTNTYGFNNATAYRYYKISAVHDGTDHPNFYEVRFFEQVFTPGATPFKDDKGEIKMLQLVSDKNRERETLNIKLGIDNVRMVPYEEW